MGILESQRFLKSRDDCTKIEAETALLADDNYKYQDE
jgi:hypothetical protein